jgi:hypothetical protein
VEVEEHRETEDLEVLEVVEVDLVDLALPELELQIKVLLVELHLGRHLEKLLVVEALVV